MHAIIFPNISILPASDLIIKFLSLLNMKAFEFLLFLLNICTGD